MQITLDHHLQNFMRVRLEGQSAAAIVMDVTNGDLLGCTSAPSFDPEPFRARGISSRDYNALETVSAARRQVGAGRVSTWIDDQDVECAGRAGNRADGPEETVACNGYVEISAEGSTAGSAVVMAE